MAERDYFNINDYIRYPFINTDDATLSPGQALPRRGLADAGFIMGLDSDFSLIAGHSVYLTTVAVTITDILLTFETDCPAGTDNHFVFTVPLDTPLNTNIYCNATRISDDVEVPDVGYGFLTIGNVEELAAIPAGVYTATTPFHIEPALIQSLVDTYARTLNLANDRRSCPPVCCPSSSSSSSEGGDDAFVSAQNLVGALRFSEGNNAQITVNPDDNSIVFNAVVGAGTGVPCDNLIVGPGGVSLDDCQNCDNLIKSINGKVTQTGKLQLTGAPWIQVVPDPDNHKLVVKVKIDPACAGSSSSASV